MTRAHERWRKQMHDETVVVAAALLVEHGFVAVSMNRVADLVGVSKPTLYSLFPTKVTLTQTVLLRSLAMLERITWTATGVETPLQSLCNALRLIILTPIDVSLLVPPLWSLDRFVTPQDREVLALQRQPIDHRLLGVIESAQVTRQIDPALPPTTVLQLFYGVAGAFGYSCTPLTRPYDPAADADTAVRLFENAVRCPTK